MLFYPENESLIFTRTIDLEFPAIAIIAITRSPILFNPWYEEFWTAHVKFAFALDDEFLQQQPTIDKLCSVKTPFIIAMFHCGLEVTTD